MSVRDMVNLGMSLSLILFIIGYFFRKTNVSAHRVLMLSGIAANLISAVILVVSVHLVYGGDMRAAGFIPQAPAWAILVHRVVAVVALLLMFAMLWTGLTRKRELHYALHRWFLPLYIAVYFSGLYIFGGLSPA